MSQQQTPESEDIQTVGIAERVRFWEEQDRINQELIPRVIRQNELLTGHIADHENLPLAAAEAARQAVSQAQETIERQTARSPAGRERSRPRTSTRQKQNVRNWRANWDRPRRNEKPWSATTRSYWRSPTSQKRRMAFLSIGVSVVSAAIAIAAIAIAVLA